MKRLKELFLLFKKGLIAGIFLSIGYYFSLLTTNEYLKVGIFTLFILTSFLQGSNLYVIYVGYLDNSKMILDYLSVLLGNILPCVILSFWFKQILSDEVINTIYNNVTYLLCEMSLFKVISQCFISGFVIHLCFSNFFKCKSFIQFCIPIMIVYFTYGEFYLTRIIDFIISNNISTITISYMIINILALSFGAKCCFKLLTWNIGDKNEVS